MQMAELTAKRSTCLRRNVGAVISKDRHVIATGYNGAPRGILHCDERGECLREKLNIPSGQRHELCRALHAEQNAICQAARHGISLEGGTLYCKMEPCRVCAMLIVTVGIKRVVCRKRYHAAQDTREMFLKAGIELVVTEDSAEQYPDQ